MRVVRCLWPLVLVPVVACGAGLNQTTVTCPPGRTFLDGVCVAEPVADYVACVRAQGAQLGSEKAQKLSADAGYLGVKAAAAAEVSETLQKKYSASDQAMLAIIQACNGAARVDSRTASRVDKDLVARWTFDEASGTGVADSSGHGNTGVVQGNPAWVSGRVGGAMKFEYAQEILVDENASQHSARAVTMTAWFLLTQKSVNQPWRTILLKSNPKGANWFGCTDDLKDPNPCDEREYGLALNSDDRYVSVDAVTEDRYQNGGHTFCNSPPGSIQYSKWHHVSAIVSPRNRAMRVYIDGALSVTCPMSEAGLRRTSRPLRIGSGMIGMLDDVRIYATELSDGDVATLAKGE